jgi:adenylate cyclase
MIPVEFEVKGKGAQHFYGVVNLPQFDIEEFFLRGDKNFVLDKDCEKACGKNGPATLNEVRELLGIPKPDFEKVNLNEEENKVQVRQ